MASISLTIPDAVVARVQAAFGGGPQVKAALIGYIKTTVRNYESEQARIEQATLTEAEITVT